MRNYGLVGACLGLGLLVSACDDVQAPEEPAIEEAVSAGWDEDVDEAARASTDTGWAYDDSCNVLSRNVWIPYGSCDAACQDLCGIDFGSVQTVWLICICGYE